MARLSDPTHQGQDQGSARALERAGREEIPHRTLIALPSHSQRTERRMVLVQWSVMPLVLAGYLLPPPAFGHSWLHVLLAAALMVTHPLLYAVIERVEQYQRHNEQRAGYRAFLTAIDITVATLVFYVTVARPGYAQVLLYCTVALAATRYTPLRALGITSLVAFLLLFAALLPLHMAPPTLASEVVGLYALTYLVALLSQAERTVEVTARENAALAETVMQRNGALQALTALARTLNAADDDEAIVRGALDGMANTLHLPWICAFKVGEEGGLAVWNERGAPTNDTAAECERRLRLAQKARDGARTVSISRQVTLAAPFQASPCVIAAVPLPVCGGIAMVVEAELPIATPADTAIALETLELFCSEVAVAQENVILRGEVQRTVILREKNRIAQDLHDTVLQMLFGVGLRLQWCLEWVPTDSALREPLLQAKRLSANAGSELRGAIFTLTSDIAEVGLVPAIERLLYEQAGRAGWAVNLVTTGPVPPLPVLVQNAAHRVVREALMNTYKHAGASEVVVGLRFSANALVIVIQDNGIGLSDEALTSYRLVSDHFGLRSVAEQVEGLGGTVTVYNNDECGAAVRAAIPLASAHERAA